MSFRSQILLYYVKLVMTAKSPSVIPVIFTIDAFHRQSLGVLVTMSKKLSGIVKTRVKTFAKRVSSSVYSLTIYIVSYFICRLFISICAWSQEGLVHAGRLYGCFMLLHKLNSLMAYFNVFIIKYLTMQISTNQRRSILWTGRTFPFWAHLKSIQKLLFSDAFHWCVKWNWRV